ncbi:Oidioi.mRNA.OKI2018_I69.PAR.g10077.t1.cds [Oikopleura dioica]|uniref:Oidioi.mRNA.OKI2018_I69.PAR.g10077.t1.cds n=1 Tax=Oikopleura dioica TaxID=34765 RepID=A0ABN7RPR3_OIKDI|nr:Oidioi.mRNA.OKI2018_I69.PAR.g10077.t1.cds [Oikopleura dioica]
MDARSSRGQIGVQLTALAPEKPKVALIDENGKQLTKAQRKKLKKKRRKEEKRSENDSGHETGYQTVDHENDNMMEDSDDDDKKGDDKEKLSKKKLKKQSRLTVAELKQIVERPDLIEMHDVTSMDPKLPVLLKSGRNSVPVPRHWSYKRKYLSAKRGIEEPPFELPEFLESWKCERRFNKKKPNNRRRKKCDSEFD